MVVYGTILLLQLLDMLEFYTGFEINDLTGEPLSDKETTNIHYRRIRALQVVLITNIYYRRIRALQVVLSHGVMSHAVCDIKLMYLYNNILILSK